MYYLHWHWFDATHLPDGSSESKVLVEHDVFIIIIMHQDCLLTRVVVRPLNTFQNADGEFYPLEFFFLTLSLLLWLHLALVTLELLSKLPSWFPAMIEGIALFYPHPQASSIRAEILTKWTHSMDRRLDLYLCPYVEQNWVISRRNSHADPLANWEVFSVLVLWTRGPADNVFKKNIIYIIVSH